MESAQGRSTRTHRSAGRNRDRRSRLAAMLLGLVILVGSWWAPVVARADDSTITIDGIDVVVTAHYSCASDTVEIRPVSMTPLDGDWPVWMSGSVYDNASRTWLDSPQWYQVDGITALTFTVPVQPGSYAYVRYAVQNTTGSWDLASVWVPIQDDLDNSPVFCG